MLTRCIRSHCSVYPLYTVTEMEFNRRRPFHDVRWDRYHQKAFVKTTPSSLLSRLIQYIKRPPAHPVLTLLLLSHFRNTLPLPALSQLILMSAVTLLNQACTCILSGSPWCSLALSLLFVSKDLEAASSLHKAVP